MKRALSWFVAGAAVLLLAAPGVAREPRPQPGRAPAEARPRQGRALPQPVASQGLTGGLAVLRAPASEEVRIAGGEFAMGSSVNEILGALELCKHEAAVALCELPMMRETILHGGEDEVTPDELLQNEVAKHKVILSAYWIDRREVTVADYLRCVDAGPCAKPPYAAGGVRFQKPELPVSLVSWEDARVYCRWRGKRLPTEAEWERAARGISDRIFPWGNEYNRRLSNHGTLGSSFLRRGLRKMSVPETDTRDGRLELAPVGSFPDGRTPDGIDDLAGNVAEWVADLYEPRYEPVTIRDPQGPQNSKSPFRVVRGGSYIHAAPWQRAASRLMATPDERWPWLGFRCVRGGAG